MIDLLIIEENCKNSFIVDELKFFWLLNNILLIHLLLLFILLRLIQKNRWEICWVKNVFDWFDLYIGD